jgi:DNA-binding NarL/FixJ family response regulator
MSADISVLVADDHALVRGGFRMILEAQPDIKVVGEAANGLDAVTLARSEKPDVVLMDVRMPELDGIEATRRVTSATPDSLRVLMLTTFDLDEYVYRAIRAGASGFLLKDVRPAELVHAVRAIHSGDTLLAPAITRRLLAEFVRRPPPGERPAALGDLTERETEVLGLIARGLSNAEIAQRLFLGETTVKTHVTRVLAKLGLRDRVQAVVLAYESGLVRPGGDGPDGAASA